MNRYSNVNTYALRVPSVIQSGGMNKDFIYVAEGVIVIVGVREALKKVKNFPMGGRGVSDQKIVHFIKVYLNAILYRPF